MEHTKAVRMVGGIEKCRASRWPQFLACSEAGAASACSLTTLLAALLDAWDGASLAAMVQPLSLHQSRRAAAVIGTRAAGGLIRLCRASAVR